MPIWNGTCDECGKYCEGVGDSMYYLCRDCWYDEIEIEDEGYAENDQ